MYIKEKKSAHFNPLKDSIKVYLPLIKYSLSSITSAVIDFILLMLFNMFFSNLFLAVTAARVCSATVNYNMNKIYVFKSDKNHKSQSLLKYVSLATIIMLANFNILNFYYYIGLPLPISKIITEISLFLASYWIQKRFIFKK